MTTRKIMRVGRTRAEIREFWLGVVRRYLHRPDAMTQAQFIERQGVNMSSFRRWLQKLRGEIQSTDAFAEVRIVDPPTDEIGKSHDQIDSAERRETTEQPIAKPSVEVRLTCGAVVRFYDPPPRDMLIAIVDVLEARSC